MNPIPKIEDYYIGNVYVNTLNPDKTYVCWSKEEWNEPT